MKEIIACEQKICFAFLNFLEFFFFNILIPGSWDSQGKNTKWFAIPFSSGPCFVRTLYYDLSIWVALHSMAPSFIELDKAVIHVISLVNFL